MRSLDQQAPSRLDATHARHVQIHQHDIEIGARHDLERLLPRRRLSDDVHVHVGEHSTEPLSEERVVVDDDDWQGRSWRDRLADQGVDHALRPRRPCRERCRTCRRAPRTALLHRPEADATARRTRRSLDRRR